MKIYPFRLHHLDMIDIQDEQREDLGLLRLSPEERRAAITLYPSFSMMDNGICYASFGQFPVDLDQNIGFMWCLLSKNMGARIVPFFRFAKDGIEGSAYDEVQTLINMQHPAAVRMITMLGFQPWCKAQDSDSHIFIRRRSWVESEV